MNIAMKGARTRASYEIDLTIACASEFGLVLSAQDFKLRNRIHTWKCQKCQVRTAINVVGTIDQIIVLFATPTVNGKSHQSGPLGSKGANVKLVRVARVRYPRNECKQLLPVTAVE